MLFQHVPVLLHQMIDAVVTDVDGCYTDVTGGAGGHAVELLKRLSTSAKVIIFDRDAQAIAVLQQKFAEDPRVTIVQERFGDLHKVLHRLGITKINGLIADLGVSSPQLDQKERGFSVSDTKVPLDLRMGMNEVNAVEWLASSTDGEIAQALIEGGDFSNVAKVATALHQAAIAGTITTIEDALETAFGNAKKLPGVIKARFVQALRIAVNDEYGELRAMLTASRKIVQSGGKVAILTFHSGEAKIVKAEFTARTQVVDQAKAIHGERYWIYLQTVTAKSVPGECKSNPRAGSAVLRTAARGITNE